MQKPIQTCYQIKYQHDVLQLFECSLNKIKWSVHFDLPGGSISIFSTENQEWIDYVNGGILK